MSSSFRCGGWPLFDGNCLFAIYSNFRPDDLLPDDTELLYDASGKGIQEIDYDDPEDEFVTDIKKRRRYIDFALAHYNAENHTDYKEVPITSLEIMDNRRVLHTRSGETSFSHCGFTGIPSTAVDCESSAKYFFAEWKAERHGQEVFTCRTVNDLKSTGCEMCDISMCRTLDRSECDMELDSGSSGDSMLEDHKKSFEEDLPLSEYSHCLADGVTLCEKERFRLPFALPALQYYNKKHQTEYKLVAVLPYCFSVELDLVVHCNFIARQNAPADDVSDKLFFAELYKPDHDWLVTVCHILHGCKTTAGCDFCMGRQGKRVVHPTHGFRFGPQQPS